MTRYPIRSLTLLVVLSLVTSPVGLAAGATNGPMVPASPTVPGGTGVTQQIAPLSGSTGGPGSVPSPNSTADPASGPPPSDGIASTNRSSTVPGEPNARFPAASDGLSIDRADGPLSFVPNAGQFTAGVEFAVRGSGRSAYFARESVTFVDRGPNGTPSAVRLAFDGASEDPSIEGLDPGTGVVNVYRGDDSFTDLPTYGRVVYRGLYPGIDLVYGGSSGVLKSEFVVEPGADPDAIRMNYSAPARVAENGSLVVEAGSNATPLVEAPPVAFQRIDGERVPVTARYVRLGSSAVGFELGSYDHDHRLVIDPTLSYLVPTYSTFLGGTRDDVATDVAVDDEGNAYVTGWTWSPDLAITANVSRAGPDPLDAFVVKYGPYGNVTFATYLVGNRTEEANAIDVAGDGSVVVVGGETSSRDFPTRNAFQPSLAEAPDAFLTALDGDGTIEYSTYLGGAEGGEFADYNPDVVNDVAVGPLGGAYVAGFTASSDFPVTTGPSFADQYQWDAFVGRFEPNGSRSYLRYDGGSDNDVAEGVAVDADGTAYVTGYTRSVDFPTSSGALQPAPPGSASDSGSTWDAFVAAFDPGGGRDYGTYIGGPSGETGEGIATDAAGNVYVTGWTGGFDLPTVNRSRTPNGSREAFLWKLSFGSNASTATVTYSTYLGGPGWDHATDLAVGDRGEVSLVGYTHNGSSLVEDPNFPIKRAFQPAFGGSAYEGSGANVALFGDAFVAKLNTSRVGSDSYRLGSYLGGSRGEVGRGIDVGPNGSVYVAGLTFSPDFPTRTVHADAESRFGGGSTSDLEGDEGFVTKLRPSPCRTDPDGNGNPDNDGDGLCDEWELHGIDVDDDGTVDLPLHRPPYDADPDYKDVFVEIDWMDCLETPISTDACDPANAPSRLPPGVDYARHNHSVETPEARQSLSVVERAFRNAPVENPNGSTGIHLHLLPDEAIPEVSPVVFHTDDRLDQGATAANDMTPGSRTFDDLKTGDPAVACDGHFGTADERDGLVGSGCAEALEARRLAFRYVVFAHDRAGNLDATGTAELPGNDALVLIGFDSLEAIWRVSRDVNKSYRDMYVDAVGSTLMHELGHTLGLHHGGDVDTNSKPNYLSVMNYAVNDNEWGRATAIPASDLSGSTLFARNTTSNAAHPPENITVDLANGTITVDEGGSDAVIDLVYVPGTVDLHAVETSDPIALFIRIDRPLDYSRAALPSLDEGSLVEPLGVGNGSGSPRWDWTRYAVNNASSFRFLGGKGPAALSPGGKRTVVVAYEDAAAATREVELVVESDDPTHPKITVPLVFSDGTIPGPALNVSDGDLRFENVSVGSSQSRSITLSNDGRSSLTFTNVTLMGPNASAFSVPSGPASSVPIASSTTATVTYAPTSPGLKRAYLVLKSDDLYRHTVAVPLSGNTSSIDLPDVEASPRYHRVQNVPVGEDRRVEVVVENEGRVPLYVEDIGFESPVGDAGKRVGGVGRAIDWNGNASADPAARADVNDDWRIETLHGYDDWANLLYGFRTTEDYADRSHASVEWLDEAGGEPTLGDYVEGVTLSPDLDGDGVANGNDTCRNTPNEGQADADGDGVGDACEGDVTAAAAFDVGRVGGPVRFEASGDDVSFRWDFGDGTVRTGESVAHAFATTGTYSVSVVAIGGGVVLVDRDDLTVEVVEPSNQPRVDATLETTANNVGAPVRVAVNATDANGSVTDLALVRPDGRVADAAACSGPVCSATLSVTPSASTWNATAGAYGTTPFVVRAVNDAGQLNVSAVDVRVYAAGDATGDGVVNVYDAAMVGRAWNASAGDPVYSDAADLTNDGRVDAGDLAVLRTTWKDEAS